MSNEVFNFTLDLDKLHDRMYHESKRPNFALALERGIKAGQDEIGEIMIDKVLERLDSYGLGGSEGIINSIDLEFTDEGVSLILKDGEGDYAMFVEFGTGVVGEENKHPMPSRRDWKYDTKEHGESGWWYPSKESDPNPTRYQAKDGKFWAWTKGMPSRPFMYETWRYMAYRATHIMNRHIKEELRRLERDFR